MSTFAFDAYGTLFDVASAVDKNAALLGDVDVAAFAALWRSKQLEYTWTRTLMNEYKDFWAITQDALRFSLARYKLDTTNAADQMMKSYATLTAYDDVVPTLSALFEAKHRVAIFTNATRHMVGEAIDSAGIAAFVHGVVSVDDIRTYKTQPGAYEHLADSLGEAPEAITLVSANRWDVAGGNAFGLKTVWVNRNAMPDEYEDLAPLQTVRTLSELVS